MFMDTAGHNLHCQTIPWTILVNFIFHLIPFFSTTDHFVEMLDRVPTLILNSDLILNFPPVTILRDWKR